MLPLAETHLFAPRALLATGWAQNVLFTLGDGRITAITPESAPLPGVERAAGPVVPPLGNLHSHAFQRLMAGLAEVSGGGDDSFWTWRETMYRMVGTLTPDDVQAIAAWLYVEMLKAGFGHVGEFHYIHHTPSGAAYSDPAEMSGRIIAAAEQAGIGLTLLPVFYAHSGFGGLAPNAGQRRFIHSVDAYLALLETARRETRRMGQHCGLAIHSLRAATPDEMRVILEAAGGSGPIHIHIAEQVKEVEDCVAHHGRRPIEWLLDEFGVDANWCLVHATHANEAEVRRMAASGAVVGLCPTTEASLGDGIFPAVDYLGAGGAFGIGTDSHVSVSPAEELRVLEYGQRLAARRRVRMVKGPHRSNGRDLYDCALAAGAAALGSGGVLAIGGEASFVVLDEEDAFISSAHDDGILDRWIFARDHLAVRDVMVRGHWKIRNRHHEQEKSLLAAFKATTKRLSIV